MGQLETAMHHVYKLLEELTASTQDGMSQLHNELDLLHMERRFSQVLDSTTTTTTGSRAGPGAPSERSLQSSMTAEICQRFQDREVKMQDQSLELPTVKLSLAASIEDMETAIWESEQRQRNGMSEEVARYTEEFEKSWGRHLQQQLEQHRVEQVSRMDFLKQLQEKVLFYGRTDAAAAQSRLDIIDAALSNLAAEHTAQHETLAVQVQQLEGSWLACQKNCDIAYAKVLEMQANLASVIEHLVVVADVVSRAERYSQQAQQGLVQTQTLSLPLTFW